MDEDGHSITSAVGIEQIVLLVFLYDVFIFCPWCLTVGFGATTFAWNIDSYYELGVDKGVYG